MVEFLLSNYVCFIYGVCSVASMKFSCSILGQGGALY